LEELEEVLGDSFKAVEEFLHPFSPLTCVFADFYEAVKALSEVKVLMGELAGCSSTVSTRGFSFKPGVKACAVECAGGPYLHVYEVDGYGVVSGAKLFSPLTFSLGVVKEALRKALEGLYRELGVVDENLYRSVLSFILRCYGCCFICG